MKEYLEYSPYIIANRIDAYIAAKTYTERFDLIEKIYTQILRHFSCICLSEYLLDTESNTKVNIAINKLIRPSIGDWLSFISTYIKSKKDTLFIHELPEVFHQLINSKIEVLSDEVNLTEYEVKSTIEAILIFRNKLRHGSYTPDENMYKAYVEVYEPCILDILDAFYDIFKKYRIVRYRGRDGIFGSYQFTQLCGNEADHFKVIELEDADLEEELDFVENDLYLLSSDNRVLPLNNLFNCYFEDEDEDYIIYDGLNKSNVRYVGLKRAYTIEKYIDQLRSKFLEKRISIKFGKKLNDMDGMRDYINELSMVSINLHERSGKYNYNNYVNRGADYDVEKFIASDKTGLIVTAEAGSGKTNLVCHVARELMNQGNIVYFINGYKLSKLTSDMPIFSEFKEELISGEEFYSMGEFFEVLHKKVDDDRKFVLIVDAVNESYCTMELLHELDRIICQLPYYHWLKVIITIRTEYYKRLKHYITERMGKKYLLFSDITRCYAIEDEFDIRRELELKNWSILQEKEAYDKYRGQYQVHGKEFFELPPSLWKLLSVPLNMKIYFTTLLYQKLDDQTDNIKRRDLFEAYHNYLLKESEELSKSTYEILQYIVEQMIINKRSSIETELIEEYNAKLIKREKIKDIIGVLTPYERLLDLNILQERRVDNWYETRFVYQAYLEFLIYLILQNKQYDDMKLMQLFVDSLTWEELPEMHDAIQLLLIEKKDNIIDLIDILLGKVIADKSKLELMKVSLIDSIYEVLIENKNDSARLISSAVISFHKYDLSEWLIDLAEQLYYENLYEEAKLLLQELEKYLDLFQEDYNKFTLYSTLGLIERSQCEAMEQTIASFDKAYLYGTEQQKIVMKAEIAKTYRINGDLIKAESILDELLKVEALQEFIIPYITVIYQRQLCYRARGQYEKSMELCKENYDRRKLVNNEEIKLNLKAEYAVELEYSGFIEEAISIGLEVMNEAAEQENMNLFIDMMNGLSRRYGLIGKYDESIQWAKEGLRLWEHSKNYRGQLVMCVHILIALKEKGATVDDAQEYIDKANMLAQIVKEELILDMYHQAISKWEGIASLKIGVVS